MASGWALGSGFALLTRTPDPLGLDVLTEDRTSLIYNASIWVNENFYGRILTEAKLKVRDIVKLLKADGWHVVVIVGSHRQMKHPTKLGRVTVSGHPF